ncbi:MAG: beta-galactosidase [Bryobacteraceae bacterium]
MHRNLCLFAALAVASISAYGKAVVFWEPGFPAVESAAPPRNVLEQALEPLHPVFAGVVDLSRAGVLAEGDLLVLPYGSAFPADAWDAIKRHLEHGNLLTIGGRPLAVPVWREGASWRAGEAGNAYSRSIGVEHTYVAPNSAGSFQWDASVLYRPAELSARRVFVMASAWSAGTRRRGIGFLVNAAGDRVATPVVSDDVFADTDTTPVARRVFLNFEAAADYWATAQGASLLRDAALHAARGPMRLWIDLFSLTLDPGDRATATLDLVRLAGGAPGSVRLDLERDGRTLDSAELACPGNLHQAVTFAPALADPGLYAVRATFSTGGAAVERYATGLWVRDDKLLHSGAALGAGRDYFRLSGKPYLPVGVNYFSTDIYDATYWTGGSLGGNAWTWERDFAEMERRGVTMARTGIWLNRGLYLDPISGAASERLLRSIEAFLYSAGRHRIQVIFTLSSFDPQTLQHGAGSETPVRMGPGQNPYTDPGAIRAQAAFVSSIAKRFKDVPFFSFDLINEPSFSNPRHPWRGNTPNGDPSELAAWREWLAKRYPSLALLAQAWNVPATELASFAAVPLPEAGDLGLSRSGNSKLVRAGDYNLFAQDAFSHWTAETIRVIREAGAKQPVTVGIDEGGVADRVLNAFFADAGVDYTTNHSYWRDDALLWDSLAAKRPDKPNLIEETGPQPVWSMDTSWRWDEIKGLPLFERKMALGFAAGNSGSLDWVWERGDTFGIMRADGSFKLWADVLSNLARFARDAQPYATEVRLPEIALVLPQSLQLSVFNNWSIEAQQKSVRALYHVARGSAYAVGEYQLRLLGNPKLIVAPAPWIMRQESWEALLEKVRAGATLLISGRIDADEHFHPVEGRTRGWAEGYAPAPLTARETTVEWPGGSARLTYSGDKTTYGERGWLPGGAFLEKQVGQGRILYFAYPLELADEVESIGRIYRYAIARAGVKEAYETSCQDTGILICPTRLPNATLYALTSEVSAPSSCTFRDAASGAQVSFTLPPGRTALLVIDSQGKTVAQYDPK